MNSISLLRTLHPDFQPEELEIPQIARLDDQTLRDLGVTTIREVWDSGMLRQLLETPSHKQSLQPGGETTGTQIFFIRSCIEVIIKMMNLRMN